MFLVSYLVSVMFCFLKCLVCVSVFQVMLQLDCVSCLSVVVFPVFVYTFFCCFCLHLCTSLACS